MLSVFIQPFLTAEYDPVPDSFRLVKGKSEIRLLLSDVLLIIFYSILLWLSGSVSSSNTFLIPHDRVP